MTLNVGWDKQDADQDKRIKEVLIDKLGFDKMMPVQKTVVPLFCKNYDCAVEAQTGSGKTLAFVLPIVNQILKNPISSKMDTRALIVSPTRELALQINAVVEAFTKALGNKMTSVCLIGGVSNKKKGGQVLTEETGRNIVVATPGRLVEIIQNKVQGFQLNQKDLHYLVLDEADRLAENNFYEEIKNIILALPKQRRTGLFSATLTSAKMEELIKLGLRNPVVIKQSKKAKTDQKPIENADDTMQGLNQETEANKISIPEKLVNYYKIYDNRIDKIKFVINYIEEKSDHKTIVFFNTCASVVYYYKLLTTYFKRICKKNIAESIYFCHGEMKQKKRQKNLEDFTEAETGVIFVTDVFSRGIDIPTVNWIIQVDCPQDPSAFIHRIGRTARKGMDGSALVLLLEYEKEYIEYLEMRSIKMLEYSKEEHKEKTFDEKSFTKFHNHIKEIMFSDKDFMLKGSRAFVSFIRSYKEHKLASIFKFDDIDPRETAKSFFQFAIPKIEEFMKWKGDWKIGTEEEIKKCQEVEFKDENKAKQYSEKMTTMLKKREKEEDFKQGKREKAEKEHKQKKVRSHAARQRAKHREYDNELGALQDDAKLMKKLKTGKISKAEYEKQTEKLDKSQMYGL